MIGVSQEWKDRQKEIITPPAHISATWYNTVSQRVTKSDLILSNYVEKDNNIFLGVGTRQQNKKYATFEPNLWKLNGEYELSESEILTDTEYYIQDIDIVGEFGVRFGNPVILAGKNISIMVSENIYNTVSSIQIIGYDGSNGLGIETFSITTSNISENNIGYYDCKIPEEKSNPTLFVKIIITPKANFRCRLNTILVGDIVSIGTQKGDDIPIMTCTQKNHADLFTETIPTNDISFELDLTNNTKINTRATVDGNSIFDKQQPIEVKFGYETNNTTYDEKYYLVLENELFYVSSNLKVGDSVDIYGAIGTVVKTDFYMSEDYKYNYMGIEYTIVDEDTSNTYVLPIEYEIKASVDIEWINIGTFFLNEWDIQQGNYTGNISAVDPITLFNNSIVDNFTSQDGVYKYSDIFSNAFKLIESYFRPNQDLQKVTNSILSDVTYPQNDVPFLEWANAWGIKNMEIGQLIQIYLNANLTTVRQSNNNSLDIFNIQDFDITKAYDSGLIGDIVAQDYLITPDNIIEYPVITQTDKSKNISTTFKNVEKKVEDNKVSYESQDIILKNNIGDIGTDYSLDNHILINNNSYIVEQYIKHYSLKLNKYVQTVELNFRADPRLQPMDIIIVKSTDINSQNEEYQYFGEDDIEEGNNTDIKKEYADIVLVTDIEYSYSGAFIAHLKGLILAYNIQLDSNKYEVYCFNDNSEAVLYTGDEVNASTFDNR